MKTIAIALVLTIGVMRGASQSNPLYSALAEAACSCLDKKVTIEQIDAQLDTCISKAMAWAINNGGPEDKALLSTAEGVMAAQDSIYQMIAPICPPIMSLILEMKKEELYRLSENEEANNFYREGTELMKNNAYAEAIKPLERAVALDSLFVIALDHLAISHRRSGDLDKAIVYYLKSLDIFPEGDLALTNIAAAYTLKNELDNAELYYSDLHYLYPDNPEGHFGLAKIAFMRSDFELALDFAFTAHRMYAESESDYVQDSNKLINMIYVQLKDAGKLDIFEAKAKEHGIEMKN